MLFHSPPVQNRILAHLRSDTFERLRPHLRRVQLDRRQVLQEVNARVSNVYFLESGVAIVLAHTRRDGHVGVALVGRFGLVGVPAVLGTMHAPNRCIMEVPGEAFQVTSEALGQAMEEHAEIRQQLLNYIQALLVQHSQTVLCNGQHELEERLARCLLLARDRLDSNLIPLTHDLFSMMLSVRRASVTDALAQLEAAGAVRRHHMAVEITDRTIVEQKTCDCYRIIAAEYRRLIGSI